MNRYTGDECAVCNVTFKDGDDVVVCPVCGTPHHRACYNKDTGCAHSDWHGVKTYEDDKNEKREETAQKCDDSTSLKCPKCGATNPSTGLFCQICGTSLHQRNTDENQAGGFSFTPPPINLNPFTTPFGGLAPDEEIDSVSAKELAVFVGDNSFYFLPKMKELKKEEKIVSWNWSAFFFDFYYFFYRKMYLLGTLILIFSLITSVPSVLYMINTMGYADVAALPDNLVQLANIANICSMLFWGVRVLCGLFSNYLYTLTTFKKIEKARKKTGSTDPNNHEYVSELALKGRTSHKAVLIVCLLQMVLAYVVGFLMI